MTCRLAAAIFVLTLAVPIQAQQSGAGRVKLSSGAAFIVRHGAQMPATVGHLLLEADTLKTGADGRIGVTLLDETRISLGPNSEVRLERFAYAPAEGRLAFAMRIVRGIAAYVSGRIAKLAPESIRLETPAAIVGVRGTRLVMRVETP